MIIIALISFMIMPLYSAEALIKKIRMYESLRNNAVLLAQQENDSIKQKQYSKAIGAFTIKSHEKQSQLQALLQKEDHRYMDIKYYTIYLNKKGLEYWPNPKKTYNPYAPVFVPSNQKSGSGA